MENTCGSGGLVTYRNLEELKIYNDKKVIKILTQ
jgi:hypothetical protein